MSSVTLDRALGNTDRVLLDSSTLIAFHDPAESTHTLATHLLRRIEVESDPLCGYFSVVSATEILVRPLRTSQPKFTFMHRFLTGFPNLTPLDVDMQVATQAATLRAARGLKTPDALIVATALLAGCQAIVTNDQAWKGRLSALFGEFTWVYLAEHT